MKNFEIDDYDKAKLILHILYPFVIGIGIGMIYLKLKYRRK